MDTFVTFSIGEVLLWLLLIVAIIALIVLISVLVKIGKLAEPVNEAVKKTNGILDDVAVIAKNAKDGTDSAKNAIIKINSTVNGLSKIVDSNRGTISAITGFANACTSLTSLFGRDSNKRRK